MVLVDSTLLFPLVFFFLNAPATTEIYTLSLHDALPICERNLVAVAVVPEFRQRADGVDPLEERSEEHTSELQSLRHLVCRLLLEKKKTTKPRRRPLNA